MEEQKQAAEAQKKIEEEKKSEPDAQDMCEEH